jgi:hypothetical protein
MGRRRGPRRVAAATPLGDRFREFLAGTFGHGSIIGGRRDVSQGHESFSGRPCLESACRTVRRVAPQTR